MRRRLRAHRDAPAPAVQARVRGPYDNPDLLALVHPLRMEGLRVRRAGELSAALAPALAARGPVIVDVPVDYSENDKLGIDLWKLASEVWPTP